MPPDGGRERRQYVKERIEIREMREWRERKYLFGMAEVDEAVVAVQV
jgi:hypothetical protein